ncbi:hypothetical protein [Devosia chinhatensis]|uniref:hypothetical protein n=1 Tax=Devosia chinhatensis TaxID=429727 RepID=UPI000696C205|nr:hypothetical protein [Devosia chinhatensis]
MAESFDYEESRQDANELIAEFGQNGAIRRTVVTPPAHPWEEGTETTVYHAVTLVVLPMDEKRIDGTLILTGDRQVLIALNGLPVGPAVGDVIMFNGAFSAGVYAGEEWTIAKLDMLAPAGIMVMYDVVARR